MMALVLPGNWKQGFAYDFHTLKSKPLGFNEYGYSSWDTTYTEMGKLVYQLKSGGDRSAVGKIVDLLWKEFWKENQWSDTIDAIIPIPSTKKDRDVQPAYEVARELGARIKVPVLEGVLEKSAGGTELKNVKRLEKKKALSNNPMILKKGHGLNGKNILLLDDLYGSGSTLNDAACTLYQQAQVSNVFVLTMTKNRSRK